MSGPPAKKKPSGWDYEKLRRDRDKKSKENERHVTDFFFKGKFKRNE